jgi:hypothetical protein
MLRKRKVTKLAAERQDLLCRLHELGFKFEKAGSDERKAIKAQILQVREELKRLEIRMINLEEEAV